MSLWEFQVLGWYGGVESELGKLQSVEVQHNSEDGHWYIKRGQPPPEQRREVKLTSYILTLLCYWRALQSFVLRKFLAESFANFLSFPFSAWITEFTLLSSVNLFPAHSFIPFLLNSMSLSKRLRMSWPSLFHPFASFRTLLNIILHRSWPLPAFWKCSTPPVPFTWSLCFFFLPGTQHRRKLPYSFVFIVFLLLPGCKEHCWQCVCLLSLPILSAWNHVLHTVGTEYVFPNCMLHEQVHAPWGSEVTSVASDSWRETWVLEETYNSQTPVCGPMRAGDRIGQDTLSSMLASKSAISTCLSSVGKWEKPLFQRNRFSQWDSLRYCRLGFWEQFLKIKAFISFSTYKSHTHLLLKI